MEKDKLRRTKLKKKKKSRRKLIEGSLLPLIIENPFEEPYIPPRTAWSFSSLKLFRKCKRKSYWKRILRLSPKREASPLVISGLVHLGLSEWYSKKGKMKPIAVRVTDEAIERIEKNADYYDQDEYDELLAMATTVVGMLVGYSLMYKKDKVQLAIDKRRDVEAWFQVNMGSFDWKGKIDMLPCTLKGKQLLMEHKAVKKLNMSLLLETLPLDPQIIGYIFGAAEGLHRRPAQVVYNLIRKCQLRRKSNETSDQYCDRIAKDYEKRPEFYFYREQLRYNKSDLAAFEFDLRKTNQEYVRLLEDSKDPLDPREWPGSHHICTEFFRTCPFLPLCIQGLDRGTARLYTQYNEGEILDSVEVKKKKKKKKGRTK